MDADRPQSGRSEAVCVGARGSLAHMELSTWVTAHGGIASRTAAADAGFDTRAVRAAARRGDVQIIRRAWLATQAPADLRAAAAAGGRLACISVAQRRGWWLTEPPEQLHLHLRPHAASDALPGACVTHWTIPLSPAEGLEESVVDALAHIAGCLPPTQARMTWESAMRVEHLSVEFLRSVRWRTQAAAACAAQAQGLSDSGIETFVAVRLSGWGVPVQQQAFVGGHRVDILIGERLVVQIDGYAFHSSSAQRGKDVAHDAELRLRGYTVLRFTYAQILHDWPAVARTLSRAIAAGLHLAR